MMSPQQPHFSGRNRVGYHHLFIANVAHDSSAKWSFVNIAAAAAAEAATVAATSSTRALGCPMAGLRIAKCGGLGVQTKLGPRALRTC